MIACYTVCSGQGNRISGKIATTEKQLHLYENVYDPVFSKVVDSCMLETDGSFLFNIKSNHFSYYCIKEVGLEFVLLPGEDIHFEQFNPDSIAATGEGAKSYYLEIFLHPMITEFSNKYSTFDNPMDFHSYSDKWKNETLIKFAAYTHRQKINNEIVNFFLSEIIYKYTLYHYFAVDMDSLYSETFRRANPEYFDFENEFKFSDSNNFSLRTWHYLLRAYVRSQASTDPSLKMKGHSFQYSMFLAIKKYLRGKSSAYALVSLSNNLYYWLRSSSGAINEYNEEIEIVKEYLLNTNPDGAFYSKFCENISNYSGLIPGDTFTNIELIDTLGNHFLCENYKDKVVYINVWGIYCGPCIKQLGSFNDLCDSFNDNKDIVFINICSDVNGKDDRIIRWKEILRKKEVKGINLYCKNSELLSGETGLMLPQHYILAKNNIIITLGAKPPGNVKGDLLYILDRALKYPIQN